MEKYNAALFARFVSHAIKEEDKYRQIGSIMDGEGCDCDAIEDGVVGGEDGFVDNEEQEEGGNDERDYDGEDDDQDEIESHDAPSSACPTLTH